MKKFNSNGFWVKYQVSSFELEGKNYLPADEVNCVLEDFNLKLSDKIYECKKCRLLFGSVRAAVYFRPGDYISIDIFVPVNCLSDYLANNQ